MPFLQIMGGEKSSDTREPIAVLYSEAGRDPGRRQPLWQRDTPEKDSVKFRANAWLAARVPTVARPYPPTHDIICSLYTPLWCRTVGPLGPAPGLPLLAAPRWGRSWRRWELLSTPPLSQSKGLKTRALEQLGLRLCLRLAPCSPFPSLSSVKCPAASL